MKFPSALEPFAERLRGPHKSIRYRFWRLPREKLRLTINNLRGRSWIDFYSDRMDEMTDQGASKLPAKVYLDRGQEFLDFLVRYGMKPEHRLLDLGCGVLRGALYFVPYLNKGNYVGTEISASRLAKGVRVMDAAGIGRDRYETHLVTDCQLKELGEQKFDIVWANSVLTHMPECDIRTLIASLKSHMAPAASFYFTYSPSERINKTVPHIEKIKDFYYPTSYLKAIFSEYGYDFEVMPDGQNQRFQSPTVKATLKQTV